LKSRRNEINAELNKISKNLQVALDRDTEQQAIQIK
jgi:hypothetical protein